MTTKENLEEMCSAYEKWVGMGNMKMAGRLLPQMIRALVTYVEEKSDDFNPNLPEGSLEQFGIFFNKPESNEEANSPFVASDGTVLNDSIELLLDYEATLAENTTQNPPPCEPCDTSKGAKPFDSVFTDDPDDMVIRTPSYLLTAAQAPTISGKVFRAQTSAFPPPHPLSVTTEEGKIVKASTEAVKPKAPAKPKKSVPARKPLKSSPASKPKAPTKPK